MKKGIILILILFSIVGYSQENISREKLKATNTLFADLHFVWRGDTIDFNSFVNQTSISQINITATSELVTDSVLKVNGYAIYPDNATEGQILQFVGGKFINVDMPGGYDSLVFNINDGYLYDYRGGVVFDSYSFDGRYAILSEMEKKITSDTLIVGSDTIVGFPGGNLSRADSSDYVTPYYLENYLFDAGVEKDGYVIKLPYNSTVQGRADNAIYLPPGWSVDAGSNQADLKITHNTGRRVFDVKVWSIAGDIETLATGNVAFSGLRTDDENTILIQGFVPSLSTPIDVKIIFAE